MKTLLDNALQSYSALRFSGLESRYLTFSDFESKFDFFTKQERLTVNKVGVSVEGRPIHSIEFGNGKTKILVWTQMHGNEATATRAFFDFFSVILNQENEALAKYLEQELSILFIPMLNPDGAEKMQRRNALDIDPNRDAVKQQSPEIQTLFNALTRFKPDWCFNMHDQRNLFNVSETEKPATVSFLSPSESKAEEPSIAQTEAMQLIARLADCIAETNDIGIARFSHEFYPTATGDNIQKMGYRTVLVESGGYLNDPHRMVARKIVFETYLHSFLLIASNKWQEGNKEDYLNMPMNDTKLFDVLIKDVTINESPKIVVDIGLELEETRTTDGVLERKYLVKDIGDLTHYYSYKTISANENKLFNVINLGELANFELRFISDSNEKRTISFKDGFRVK